MPEPLKGAVDSTEVHLLDDDEVAALVALAEGHAKDEDHEDDEDDG